MMKKSTQQARRDRPSTGSSSATGSSAALRQPTPQGRRHPAFVALAGQDEQMRDNRHAAGAGLSSGRDGRERAQDCHGGERDRTRRDDLSGFHDRLPINADIVSQLKSYTNPARPRLAALARSSPSKGSKCGGLARPQSGWKASGARPTGLRSRERVVPGQIPMSGIHHLRLTVTDVDRSREFYNTRLAQLLHNAQQSGSWPQVASRRLIAARKHFDGHSCGFHGFIASIRSLTSAAPVAAARGG